jgi:hypothetical protein
MPSNAYVEYKKNLSDVHRLILLHNKENGLGAGKRGLGHLTRSGLLLLCAAWERYIETVLEEGVAFLGGRLQGHTALPKNVRKKVEDYVNSNNTPWSHADLATHSWTKIYSEAVKKKVAKLNTPKHGKLKPLFENYLGISDIGHGWSGGVKYIDDFVTLRGEVAHRGGQSRYIRFGLLERYEKGVTNYAVETDNFLSDRLKILVNPQERPWNRVLC